MKREQFNMRWPTPEMQSAREQARAYGISLAAYVRALALEDREREHRKQLLAKSHPQKHLDKR